MKNLMNIFKDDNDWNEKSIIGFLAFAVMIIVILVDLVCNFLHVDFTVTEFTYTSFLTLVLGCFGIGSAEKIFGKGKNKNKQDGE